jgi:hypothetical protein
LSLLVVAVVVQTTVVVLVRVGLGLVQVLVLPLELITQLQSVAVELRLPEYKEMIHHFQPSPQQVVDMAQIMCHLVLSLVVMAAQVAEQETHHLVLA